MTDVAGRRVLVAAITQLSEMKSEALHRWTDENENHLRRLLAKLSREEKP